MKILDMGVVVVEHLLNIVRICGEIGDILHGFTVIKGRDMATLQRKHGGSLIILRLFPLRKVVLPL